jgi:hypothetical protein
VNEQEILGELGSLMDQLAALPSDAFAERNPLLERQAVLRDILAAAQVEAGRNAADAWSGQAARKKSDDEKPFIAIYLPESPGGF